MGYGHAAVAALIDEGDWQIDYVTTLEQPLLRVYAARRSAMSTSSGQWYESNSCTWFQARTSLVETAHSIPQSEAEQRWDGMLKQYKDRTREPAKGWAVFRAMVPSHHFSKLMWERHQSGRKLTKKMRDKLRDIIEERRDIINARLLERANALRMEAETDLKKRIDAADKLKSL